MRSFFRKFSHIANLPAAEKNGSEEWLAYEATFLERLTETLSLDLENPSELKALDELAGNVGPQGYLELAPTAIAQGVEIDGETVERVRKRLMAYEERGIGATNFREYFLFQCRRGDGVLNRAAALLRSEEKPNELLSVLRFLRKRLPAGPFGEILSRLADGRLRSHPPMEGLWADGSISWGAPDLIFYRKDGSWSIQVPPEGEDWPEQLRIALKMRRDTLLRVGEFLLTEQRLFFEEGPPAIRPLRQKDGADRLGLNSSTFSRAIRGKCIRTPFGFYRLGQLFCRSRESSSLLLEYCIGEIFRDSPAALLRPKREMAALLLSRYGIRLSTGTICEKIRHLLGRK
jgi:RNA polymerase sigma-54 factor